MKALIILVTFVSIAVWSHGGGLNKDGCHNDRKNGGYHCHRVLLLVCKDPPTK